MHTQLHTLEAPLPYLAAMTERPYSYAYTPPPGVSRTNRRIAAQTVPLRDARPLADHLSLDRHGFALTRHPSAVTNFYDEDEVRAVYYPECQHLLMSATGAARVVVFDHIVRCAIKARNGEQGIREPVKGAHNDYTVYSGPQRLRDLLPDEAEALLAHRFAIINVWRPIGGPVQESPLAVCDAQSLRQDDFVASDLLYPHRTGETYAVTYRPTHAWYYVPQMRVDDALLLKCYDSATDGRARFTAHTAFDDPTSPPEAAPRESIETRAFVFFALGT
jgi:hypothetical protein